MDRLMLILDQSRFMPHGHCFLWYPELLWLHVGSDALIVAAYLAIPLTLLHLVKRRRDLPFHWMFALFGTFIVACGASHAMSIWTIWQPDYWLSGGIKVVTAFASVGTALLLMRLVPVIVALPSPEMLRRKNDELGAEIVKHQQTQAALAASLQEKEVLLKEVHHRVKNNLQVVSSLLQLQTGYAEHGEAHQLLKESQDRIQSMALIHEKLYQTNDYAQVDFADYLDALVPMLEASNAERAPGARITIDTDPVWLNIDQAIPAGLVLNELVANSYKHGFPGGREGTIRVGLKALDADRVRMSVADDGVGAPAGFAPAAGATLGLRLVHILAEQLDATLTIAHERGFACDLVFNRPARIVPGAFHVRH